MSNTESSWSRWYDAATTSDFWTIIVGGRKRVGEGEYEREIYVREVWRACCTKQEYVSNL